MDVMAETIKDQYERLYNMGLKIGALRDIELDGAADVAIIGVYVKQLEQRNCPCIKIGTCCAVVATENLIEVYGRLNNRRMMKADVFATDEAPKATKKKKVVKEVAE